MDRMEEYRAQGYTVFEGLYDETTMQAWRDEQDRLQALSTEGPHVQERTHWFGNMLERAPQLMWPAVAHPAILDFAEQVVGPFVQLDNLTLAAFPSMDPEEAAGKVSAWHRDRWGRMPNGAYERPLAFNAICYLQDLNDEYGPLRVLPGSHVEPIALAEEEIRKPHQDELLIYMKAGDVVLTHNGLLHSGTPNTSETQALLLQRVLQYLLAQTHGYVHRSQLPTTHQLGPKPTGPPGPALVGSGRALAEPRQQRFPAARRSALASVDPRRPARAGRGRQTGIVPTWMARRSSTRTGTRWWSREGMY